MPKAQKGYHQAAERISRLIAEAGLRSGTRLPGEISLSKYCGVSRPTLRQAMILLEIAGEIEVRAGVGAFVREGSNPLFIVLKSGPGPLELLGARLAIEGEVAAAAAVSASAGDLAGINRSIAKMRALIEQNEDVEAVDREFHMLVCIAAKSNVLASLVGGLWMSMTIPSDKQPGQRLNFGRQRMVTFADHQAIYHAIDARNPGEARRAMRRHLMNMREELSGDFSLSDPQSFRNPDEELPNTFLVTGPERIAMS